tara:strand:- start:490 stop:1125 length:636 start_codon:yes stop_codon:yes gene_type:complete
MSRLITNAIRSTSASADAITMDGSGNVTFPANVTCSGTATGFGGGKILQVETNSNQDSSGSLSIGSQSTPVDIPNQSVSITPSATNSKILVSFHQMGETSSGPQIYYFVLKRAISGGSTTIIAGTSSGNRTAVFTQPLRTVDSVDRNTTPEYTHCSGYLDSPNTTSAVTYTVQIGNMEGTGTYYYNRSVDDGNYSSRERGLSWITVQEVAA